MKAYVALTQNELRLAFRDKQVLFFNFIFPLIFFFLFSAITHAERGGSTIAVVVTNVLVIGILGNGFFGSHEIVLTDIAELRSRTIRGEVVRLRRETQ